MQILWRTRGVTKSFMAKHFAYERFNIEQKRLHTFFTYAFSHYGFLTYCIIINNASLQYDHFGVFRKSHIASVWEQNSLASLSCRCSHGWNINASRDALCPKYYSPSWSIGLNNSNDDFLWALQYAPASRIFVHSN